MKPLLLQVDDIKESGQPWEGDLSREDLDEVLVGDHPTEFHAGGAAHVRAKLTKLGKKVLVQAKFTVPLTGQCKRCLTDVPAEESVDATLTYVPAPEAPREQPARSDEKAAKRHSSKHQNDEEGSEGSFDPELVDEEPYTGKTIDLAKALREQVLLALPPSPLCKEDCKGLCAVCGQDRNKVDCGHSQTPPDPRWEALKAVQLEPKKE